jgi:Domain of unknown function (DUF1825)
MSSFFDSEIIQTELEEINDLQRNIYKNILSFGSMNREEKMEHIEKLSILLEKQKIMYARLSLTDDEKAIEMKNNLQDSLKLMGFPPETNMNLVFEQMEKTVEYLKKYLDR